MGRGGGYKMGRGGGKLSFTPYRKEEWGRTIFSHAEDGGGGWGEKGFEAVLLWALEVLAMLKGTQTVFTLLKGGGTKLFTLS